MGTSTRLQNADYLRSDQYKDSRNLGDRAQLHHLFSTNPLSWPGWVFSFLDLHPGSNVLECGAGPGWLWRNNLERIPGDCRITLTDLSPGMVKEAKTSLASSDHDFVFRIADIAKLPFEPNTFDIVIANHMLYHVADRGQALSEVQRVLRPQGTFVATTVGVGHMGELHDLARKLLPDLMESIKRFAPSFTMENGRAQLEPWFSPIELHLYQNNLEVTEVEPILSYVLSSSEAREFINEAILSNVTQELEHLIVEQGAFHVTTNSGLFRAQCNK